MSSGGAISERFMMESFGKTLVQRVASPLAIEGFHSRDKRPYWFNDFFFLIKYKKKLV